jgi:hypothetical protein
MVDSARETACDKFSAIRARPDCAFCFALFQLNKGGSLKETSPSERFERNCFVRAVEGFASPATLLTRRSASFAKLMKGPAQRWRILMTGSPKAVESY